jgi:hypothetical protein
METVICRVGPEGKTEDVKVLQETVRLIVCLLFFRQMVEKNVAFRHEGKGAGHISPADEIP